MVDKNYFDSRLKVCNSRALSGRKIKNGHEIHTGLTRDNAQNWNQSSKGPGKVALETRNQTIVPDILMTSLDYLVRNPVPLPFPGLDPIYSPRRKESGAITPTCFLV